eukprot:3458766-Alexandrium_andersonii.AAC.1
MAESVRESMKHVAPSARAFLCQAIPRLLEATSRTAARRPQSSSSSSSGQATGAGRAPGRRGRNAGRASRAAL